MTPRKYGSSLAGGNLITKSFFILTNLLQVVKAIPLGIRSASSDSSSNHREPMSREDFFFNMFTSVFLVLAGGVFAGLTLGLMGQDEVYLKVIQTSGEPEERKHARKVLRLIGRGKHWVLVTLLLCNVITNESLPIVLDNCLGGGWPAVVASTASIVVFGEIIPQSICVRYGLQVGSMFAPFVLVLMYVMYPIAYPISCLLDHILGEDHGTVYKKSGLKTLVNLHHTMGVEKLHIDEVTIITAVLDLKEKKVFDIMTPMQRVFTMSEDTILDEKTVEVIFNSGFSRIPIHRPGEPLNFTGMLLVRILISYDPEDALPISSFPLATLPETRANISCLSILNYFQEGNSHMVLVSQFPGEPYGALGVLTLEDVIEELIGEEIVDELDVYMDINNRIERKHPGPLSKRHLTSYLHNLYHISANNSKRNSLEDTPLKSTSSNVYTSPKLSAIDAAKSVLPKNPASNPLETTKTFVTIKKPAPPVDTVLAQPNRQPGSLNDSNAVYGAIHLTESGALKDAKHRFQEPDEAASLKKFLQDDIINGGSSSDKQFHRLSSINSGHQEARSYRTGNIIESVVSVKGVNKIVIDNVTDEEAEEERAGLLSSFNNGHK